QLFSVKDLGTIDAATLFHMKRNQCPADFHAWMKEPTVAIGPERAPWHDSPRSPQTGDDTLAGSRLIRPVDFKAPARRSRVSGLRFVASRKR
ncbi:MAG TPA: hypothetical protein VIS96_12090, partial [Terrimicrobiaceae bacterium]